MALLAHADKTELQKKTWGLLPDGSTDDTVEPVSINKNIHLLVGSRCDIGIVSKHSISTSIRRLNE